MSIGKTVQPCASNGPTTSLPLSANGVYWGTVRPALHTVIEMPEYLSRARRLLSDDERVAIVDSLAANPTAGDLIVGGGGARKLRWAAKGKGKSGGVRVITFFGGMGIPVFLLSVFGKGDKANLTMAERNKLRMMLSTLATEYRKGGKRRVQGR